MWQNKDVCTIGNICWVRGNLQVNKKTLQFIQIIFTTGQMWQNTDACTMGKNLLGAWISLKNRKLKRCVEHFWWTLSNRWRKNRWSRLWEFIGHRSNVEINKKTRQFIAGDCLQLHWKLIKVFKK